MTAMRLGSAVMQVGFAALVLASGCGGSPTVPMVDGGTSDLSSSAQLSLTVSFTPPAVAPDLVIAGGQIELEGLGVVGDTTFDARTQVPEVSFKLDGPSSHSFVFNMAVPGIYSRLRADVDDIEITGTWRGVPLHITTDNDERVVDIRGPDEELSATQGASFSLVIDGTQWLTASLLDSVPIVNGSIAINATATPTVLDQMMTLVTASFSLTAP